MPALVVLPYLFPSVGSRMRSKKYWKPSKLEMQEGFILHIKVKRMLKTILIVLK